MKCWLIEGDLKKLEQVLLDGRGHLLLDKTSENEAVREFLQGVSKYQVSFRCEEHLHYELQQQCKVQICTVNSCALKFIYIQSKIDAIHKAVEEGDLRRVQSLIDREQLATARDRYGNS